MIPDEITLFVDRSAGAVTVPSVLRATGFRVVLHDEVFPVETPDHVWIAEVAARGWFAVTLDYRIYYSPISKKAALRAGAGVFVVRVSSPNAGKLAAALEAASPRLVHFVESRPRPFFAKVYADGTIRPW